MANSTITKDIKQMKFKETTGSAGIIVSSIPFSSIISVKVVTGYQYYCAVRESSGGYGALFFFTSSGGNVYSANNTEIEFVVVYQ